MKKMKSYFIKLWEKVCKSLKKTNKVKSKRKKFIFMISIATCIFILLTSFGNVIISSLTTSIYNINDLSSSLDNLKVGDSVNYEINGYSDWKILSIDKENGTIEVTSNSNVYDLTIEPNKTVDEYNAIFQAEADKFNDNNYVISSRTINKADSLLMVNDEADESEEEFWLANVNENTLMTNKTGTEGSSAIYTRSTAPSISEVYVIPYISVVDHYGGQVPIVGSTLNLSFKGIDQWIFSGQTGSDGDPNTRVLIYLASEPIALPVNGVDNIYSVVDGFYKQFSEGGSDNSEIRNYGNALSQWPWANKFSDIVMLYEGKNYFTNKNKVMYFVYNRRNSYVQCQYYYCYNPPTDSDYVSFNTTDSKYNVSKTYDGSIYRIDTNDLDRTNLAKDVSTYYEPKTLTFGYRPVLKLKTNEKSSGKEISESLHIGDYIRYEANGYKNWRVLSINKSDGTVDIVSGGFVKNLSLYGKEDYDNYENILQREVDAYKNGDNVISARAIKESDIDLLKNLKNDIDGLYWFNKKSQRHLDDRWDVQTSVIEEQFSYDAGVLYSSNSGKSIEKYFVKLYTHLGNVPDTEKVEKYLGDGDLSYIAGLRPIITLKYDFVETISEEEVQDIKKETKKDITSYIKEQKRINVDNVPNKIDDASIVTDDSIDTSIKRNIPGVVDMPYYDDGVVDVLGVSMTNDTVSWILIVTFVMGTCFSCISTGVIIHFIKGKYMI